MVRSCRRCAIGLIFGLAIPLMAGCAKNVPASSTPPPAPVTVAVAQVKSVPVQLKAIGTVRVFATVAVRPRVSGELTEVHFVEGEYVTKGEKLFTVDPRPYKTAFDQAKAIVERDQAVLNGAELALKRSESISRPTALAAEELDRLRAEAASARATVAADRAALRTAELQLQFTVINSPIDGRTGSLLVTPGNLVIANDMTPLVVINQITPISVSFAVPEQHLALIEASLLKHDGTLPVKALLKDGTPALDGELKFINNIVDTTTGTVQLKATFLNLDRRLWPGQFVDVILTLTDRPKSVTIPSAAVQDGQKGQYVFVVREDTTAEMRSIEVAFISGGEAVVSKGLVGGETVITDGHLRVTPDSKVSVKGSESRP
ncbi:MAG: efflux RND transporter periplasmic adaptor subunit [Planctomycetes bacterium]|nr:efflux RND transporter periplasmic adaptor subunit [Planctomycetota bacterium]